MDGQKDPASVRLLSCCAALEDGVVRSLVHVLKA